MFVDRDKARYFVMILKEGKEHRLYFKNYPALTRFIMQRTLSNADSIIYWDTMNDTQLPINIIRKD